MSIPDQLQADRKERARGTRGVSAIAAVAIAGAIIACGARDMNTPATTRTGDSHLQAYRVAAGLSVWDTTLPDVSEPACGKLAEIYITEPIQPINGYVGLPLGNLQLQPGAHCHGTLGQVFVPLAQTIPVR